MTTFTRKILSVEKWKNKAPLKIFNDLQRRTIYYPAARTISSVCCKLKFVTPIEFTVIEVVGFATCRARTT